MFLSLNRIKVTEFALAAVLRNLLPKRFVLQTALEAFVLYGGYRYWQIAALRMTPILFGRLHGEPCLYACRCDTLIRKA